MAYNASCPDVAKLIHHDQFFIIMLLSFIFVPPQYLFNTKISYYNASSCYDVLREEYIEPLPYLHYIRVFGQKEDFRGGYYWASGIELYGNCDREVIRHELTHALQYERGFSYNQALNHNEAFYNLYFELSQKINS